MLIGCRDRKVLGLADLLPRDQDIQTVILWRPPGEVAIQSDRYRLKGDFVICIGLDRGAVDAELCALPVGFCPQTIGMN